MRTFPVALLIAALCVPAVARAHDDCHHCDMTCEPCEHRAAPASGAARAKASVEKAAATPGSSRPDAYHEIFGDGPRSPKRRSGRKGKSRKKSAPAAAASPAPVTPPAPPATAGEPK